MTDLLSSERRSENMRRIRSKGMKPELVVRSLVHALGYRYRLHRKDLAGKPDLVFSNRRKLIFVHGCFWHGHHDRECVDGRHLPKSNRDYWLPKLARNKERDASNIAVLLSRGWSILLIWECETSNRDRLRRLVRRFLEGK